MEDLCLPLNANAGLCQYLQEVNGMLHSAHLGLKKKKFRFLRSAPQSMILRAFADVLFGLGLKNGSHWRLQNRAGEGASPINEPSLLY
jgi:hypothetical protein